VNARAAVSAATGRSLQGDGAAALKVLQAVPEREFKGADATYRQCMVQRFGEPGRSDRSEDQIGDAWVTKVLAAYRSYWLHSLLNPTRREREAARLLRALNASVGTDAKSFDVLEPTLKAEFLRRRLHALLGQTGVLHELMLWRNERVQTYHVSLPEGPHETTVHVLDDFLSLGWGDYATCGRRGTGGWATSDALYAVVPRYPGLESEEFRVTFLGHETQHFADMTRFRDLQPWELEYRAKLTELAQAKETRGQVLLKFTEDQGDDARSPHSFANKQVLRAMRARLRLGEEADLDAVPLADIQAAARDALVEDSNARLRTGLPAGSEQATPASVNAKK
jgi:hypothetical protein